MYTRKIPSVRKAQSTLQFQRLGNSVSFITLFTPSWLLVKLSG